MWCLSETWTQPDLQNKPTDRNSGSPPGIWSTPYIWGLGRRQGSGWSEWLESIPLRRHGICRKKEKNWKHFEWGMSVTWLESITAWESYSEMGPPRPRIVKQKKERTWHFKSPLWEEKGIEGMRCGNFPAPSIRDIDTKFNLVKKPSAYLGGWFKRQNYGTPHPIYDKNIVFLLRINGSNFSSIFVPRITVSPKHRAFILWTLWIM